MKSIYIVDDDLSIVAILKDIIEQHFQNTLVGTAHNGVKALNDILELRPDILLLDYLLPDKDGLQMIRDIKKEYSPAIVMISEVSDNQMIAKAYREKIEFFIHKPLNVIEVVSVINKVMEYQDIKNTLNQFETALFSLRKTTVTYEGTALRIEQKLRKLYNNLGLLGTTGSEDLIKAAIWAKSQNGDYTLSEMYQAIVKDQVDFHQIDAFKKRIGRVITKAFKSMASLGIEDNMNVIFETYAYQLFNFTELRKEMLFLTGKSKYPGKIDIKQFIESSIVLAEEI